MCMLQSQGLKHQYKHRTHYSIIMSSIVLCTT
uniref:Uncharacterized protein n=1 Tax=Arundo donax TaxID=35708 RepID=A0A0A9B0V5_ARUDO